MRAEFFRPDDPTQVVAIAHWDGSKVAIAGPEGEPLGEELAGTIRHAFRPAPVVVNDPFLRGPGTRGPAVLEPGDSRWFMAAARTRLGEGLAVRFAPGPEHGMGWDPAGAYDSFRRVTEPDRAAPAPPA
jgi:hypothetical protein